MFSNPASLSSSRAPFWTAALGCLLLGLGLAAAKAAKPEERVDPPVADRPEFQAALTALAEGLPEVAVVKWERLLKDGQLNAKDSSKVAGRMVDALVRAKLGEKALLALTLFHVPDESFWKAQACVLLGRFKEAERSLRDYLATDKPAYAGYANLLYGQVAIAEGRENAGRKALREMVDDRDPAIARRARIWSSESELVSVPERGAMVLRRLAGPERVDPEMEFVRGCAALSSGDAQQAQSIFHWLLDPRTVVFERLHEAAIVRRAEAFAMLGKERTAERLMIDYLKDSEERSFGEAAFALLRKVADTEDDTASSQLLEWARMSKHCERQALALYHYAGMLIDKGKRREAIPFLEEFLQEYPGNPHESDALRLAMECQGAAGNDDRVLELANLWREKFSSTSEGTVDYLTGMIRFSRREFGEAETLFLHSAEVASDATQKERALYNSAISALFGGNLRDFESSRGQIQKIAAGGLGAADAPAPGDGADDPAAKLLLERGLHLAKHRESGTEAVLQEFLKTYPEHPRAVEAQVALAEFCLLADPPRPKAAEAALEAARHRNGVPDEWKERIDYTEMWLREARSDYEGTAEEGVEFLKAWPKSHRRDEIRMKVAQSYYRLDEYTKALTQFEQLIEENPDSAYAEAARFFAGKAGLALMSEAGLDKAIEHWSEVAERGGPLAMEARRQQAMAKRRQGKNNDALAVIEAMLTGKPAPEGDFRQSLLIEKGELELVSAAKDPKYLEAAATTFRLVQQNATASRAWRNRAGFLLAQCYHKMGKFGEALDACDDVVNSILAVSPPLLTPPDYLWLYRAGFFALDMLEAKEQWSGAARLADRLAEAGGERSEEARQRATQIRLAHYLWDK